MFRREVRHLGVRLFLVGQGAHDITGAARREPSGPCALSRAAHTVPSAVARRQTRAAALRMAIAGVLFFPAAASAQGGLDAAQAHFDAARFQEAIEAYDRAEQRASLTLAQLQTLYEGRARAKQATGDDPGARRDLQALLSLAPDRDLGRDAPPALLRLHDEVRVQIGGPLSVRASAVPVPEGWVLGGEIRGDVARITRSVRLHYQGEDGVWRTASGPEVLAPPSPRLRFVAEAIGAGGALLASHGSRAAPREVNGPGEGEPSPIVEATRPVNRRPLFLGLGAGAAAVVVLIALLVAAPYGDSGSRPSRPMEIP